jgi:serine/threonine protein kinase
VHGHLKPSNIMGVADRLKISSDRIYKSELKGAPLILSVYDPPELATGAASPAADVWSIGATLVEALTQGLPRWKDMQKDPILPHTVPAPFFDIVQQCLRLDPERRWTVAEIAARLQQISPAREEQPRKSSRRAQFSLAVVAIVVGRSLVNPRQSIRRSLSSTFEQPMAQERGKRVPATPEGSHSTKRNSNEQEGLSNPSPAPSPFQSEAKRAMPSDGASLGELMNQVLPDVPTKARASIQGRVKVSVRVRVDPSGSVVDAKLDSAGPSKYFANLALEGRAALEIQTGDN